MRLCLLAVLLAAPLFAQNDVEPWPPEALAKALAAEPASELDKHIKSLIESYEARIAKLKAEDAFVRASMPSLRDNLTLLYREYNQDKKRYPQDHFPVKSCIESIEMDMKRFLDDALEQNIDPLKGFSGRWARKVCWIPETALLAHYDLIVPNGYDPAKKYPVIYSFQSDPDDKFTRSAGYFLIRSIQVGYPKSFVGLEYRTRAILEDASLDFNIDPLRIYGTGFSYGGHTDLVFAWRFPDIFAAIVPICNDLRDERAPFVKYIRTPTFLLYGNSDSFLGTGKKLYDWMVEAKCPVKWETYEGGHDATFPFQKNPKMLTDFFEQHKLDPNPKTITKIVEHPRYSRAFWVNAKLVKNAPAKATFSVRVLENNRIEVDANDEIAALDLYLNSNLVDMEKPVTVASGEKVLFEGPAAAKVTIKIRDGEEYRLAENKPLYERLDAVRRRAGFEK